MNIFLPDSTVQKTIDKLQECIIKNEIDYIIPLARKGDLFFKYLNDQSKNFMTFLTKNNIKVVNDRTLNKEGNYECLRSSNILLFDDSVKTGNHFIHTVNYLKNKINKNISIERDDFDFFYYAQIKCKDTKLNEKLDKSKLYVSEENVSIKDYFDFCHDESIYLQKNLFPTSTDLPIFKTSLKEISLLKEILMNIQEFHYNDTIFTIANEKFNLGVLIIDDKPLRNIVGDFLISASCKIRYEYYSDSKKYDVLLTPFAICDSISYQELEFLYNSLFNKSLKAKTKAEMNCNFVTLYRDIIFLLSYFIGDIIKNKLKEYDITLKFESMNYDLNVSEAIDRYNENGIASFCHDTFYYTPKIDNQRSLAYSLEQIKVNLYDRVVRNKNILNTDTYGQYDYDYNFVELNSLTGIYKNVENRLYFVTALFTFLENYSMSNEIEFNFGNCWIERGLCAGELSISTLPFYDNVFYTGLYYFYKKIHKDYQLYKKYYESFIKMFFVFLKNEDYFRPPYISIGQFQYLSDYYRSIEQQNFHLIIESKAYLCNQNDEKLLHIIEWIDFLSKYSEEKNHDKN